MDFDHTIKFFSKYIFVCQHSAYQYRILGPVEGRIFT
jgi:hypothetical protein